MAAASAVWGRDRKGDFVRFNAIKGAGLSMISREPHNAVLTVEGIIDPLSTQAQALTPLLVLMQEWLQPIFRIYMNPQLSLAEVPLKNYYRYAHPPKNEFNPEGVLQAMPDVVFHNLPASKTLTMNPKVPEPWLVEPTMAVYDMDNLVLEKVPERTVTAVLELEALMITGHCYERGIQDPPRGLQLLLGPPGQPHMVDTIVMANLGYFQLKASPGLWNLQLAPGRSSELYYMAGLGDSSQDGPLNQTVVVDDLSGKLVRLAVVKRPGKETEKLLLSTEEDEDKDEDEDDEQRSIWGAVLGALGGKQEKKVTVEQSKAVDMAGSKGNQTINTFSIASGHLYERFTKIMILSVLRHTKRPVKFWFIKNYLSPGFKAVIPVMAAHYGFEAELVTYKWPSWLHKQTEKQRLIWAYKILFLDVLFPLSTTRVIFVDADQIVRTDMAELYDMDLKGAPYGYTPMCDNNVEMEGYRFWKQGFWRDHLGGKPYHISALYVVDLARFRQLAAGDHLRVIYESLSKDPNSLANLDQDLPNYAQHQVPIFSLPQEWLWCESWCGNATKPKAKTIDLCNNPMTKEPKLVGARRIVEEWTALDDEQRQFTESVEAGQWLLTLGGETLTAAPTAADSVGASGGNSEMSEQELKEEVAARLEVENESSRDINERSEDSREEL